MSLVLVMERCIESNCLPKMVMRVVGVSSLLGLIGNPASVSACAGVRLGVRLGGRGSARGCVRGCVRVGLGMRPKSGREGDKKSESE